MSLDGATILIVEPEIGTFVISLQEALEAVGAQSIVVRDATEAQRRCYELKFSAALLNAEHREIEDDLAARGLPVMRYAKLSSPRAIIAALRLGLRIEGVLAAFLHVVPVGEETSRGPKGGHRGL
jgi:hypothetical protein